MTLKTWPEMADDISERISCSERWETLASSIGCRLHGHSGDFRATLITPDDTHITVGPKFRAALIARLIRSEK